MSLVVTPAYTWTDGDLVTATRLTATGTPTIADGQAAVFSTVSTSGLATLSASATVTGLVQVNASADQAQVGIRRNGGVNNPGLNLRANETGNKVVYDTIYSVAAPDQTWATNGSEIMRLGSAGGLAVTGAISATTSATSATLAVSSDATIGGILTYSGGLKYVVADFSKSSNFTLSDVTGLSVNVVNGGVYRFVVASPLSQAGAGGYKVGIGGTATLSAGGSVYQYLTSTVANSVQGNLGAGGFSVANITGAASAAFLWHGTFTASSTGTVTVQFAQNASVAAPCFFGAGSYFEVVRVS